jgi:hypothetical protein
MWIGPILGGDIHRVEVATMDTTVLISDMREFTMI